MFGKSAKLVAALLLCCSTNALAERKIKKGKFGALRINAATSTSASGGGVTFTDQDFYGHPDQVGEDWTLNSGWDYDNFCVGLRFQPGFAGSVLVQQWEAAISERFQVVTYAGATNEIGIRVSLGSGIFRDLNPNDDGTAYDDFDVGQRVHLTACYLEDVGSGASLQLYFNGQPADGALMGVLPATPSANRPVEIVPVTLNDAAVPINGPPLDELVLIGWDLRSAAPNLDILADEIYATSVSEASGDYVLTDLCTDHTNVAWFGFEDGTSNRCFGGPSLAVAGTPQYIDYSGGFFPEDIIPTAGTAARDWTNFWLADQCVASPGLDPLADSEGVLNLPASSLVGYTCGVTTSWLDPDSVGLTSNQAMNTGTGSCWGTAAGGFPSIPDGNDWLIRFIYRANAAQSGNTNVWANQLSGGDFARLLYNSIQSLTLQVRDGGGLITTLIVAGGPLNDGESVDVHFEDATNTLTLCRSNNCNTAVMAVDPAEWPARQFAVGAAFNCSSGGISNVDVAGWWFSTCANGAGCVADAWTAAGIHDADCTSDGTC